MLARLPPPAGSVRCAVEGVTPGSVNWANIFWVLTSFGTTPTVAQCNAFAEDVYGVYNTHFWSLLGKDATLKRCLVNWYGTAPAQVAGGYETDTAGGSSNDTEVDSLAAVVSWAFGATWRGGKPRTYLPCLPTEAFATSNSLDGTFISNVESAAGDFISGISGISAAPFTSPHFVITSFFSGNAQRNPPEQYTITGAICHPRICSQRRRLGKEVI